MKAVLLDQLSKEEVADIAAMLFNYQLLGPTVILDLAQQFPWLVERAPKRWEMEAILDLARRGKTVNHPDDEFYRLASELREKYRYDR